ncbi:MAG: hypothetical protein V1753_07800 [Pseudomonadota bacterium]
MKRDTVWTLLLTAVVFSFFYYFYNAFLKPAIFKTEPPSCKITVTDQSYCKYLDDTKTKTVLADTREKLGEKEYIKINLAELVDICERNDKKKLEDRYVIQGIVYKEPALETKGGFGLLRVVNWCCPTHLFANGFLTIYDSMYAIENDQWIKVYGKLQKAEHQDADDQKIDEKINTKLAPTSYIVKKWVLVADKVEKTSPPSAPYITTWNTKEPFYY